MRRQVDLDPLEPVRARCSRVFAANASEPRSVAAQPGVYCQRTTLVELDNATLWRTYTMTTPLESMFRSLETDLGLRAVFHKMDRRVEGQLLRVLAYHFVHMLRLQLEARGIDDSWETLRETLAIPGHSHNPDSIQRVPMRRCPVQGHANL